MRGARSATRTDSISTGGGGSVPAGVETGGAGIACGPGSAKRVRCATSKWRSTASTSIAPPRIRQDTADSLPVALVSRTR